MTDYNEVLGISTETDDAYMYDSYGEKRWMDNITELLEYGYTRNTVVWIVRSKIERWADDYDMTMLTYIQRHVGDVKLSTWIREGSVA